MKDKFRFVWVFCGQETRFPSGVFEQKENATQWIGDNRLTGTLTAYPLGVAVYDWAISEGFFEVTKEKHKSPNFIQGFTSASMQHYHYKDGQPD
tara:strand:+ start:143 stop:424 length:282 start_codon:yes stop_codon:yes gene_type:complete